MNAFRLLVLPLFALHCPISIWAAESITAAPPAASNSSRGIPGAPTPGVPTTAAQLANPRGIAVDPSGNLIIGDYDSPTLFKISPSGNITVIAAPTELAGTCGLTVDSVGNIFVADSDNNCIRKVTPSGNATVFAGSPSAGGSTDGPAADARFSIPTGVAVDTAGNLYVSDNNNATVRKITPAGVVSTLAGKAGEPGTQDGPGAIARFSNPRGITVDKNGNVFVADEGNSNIRRIAPDGTVSTYAGKADASGNQDGPAATATFNGPRALTVDANGNVYVADTNNNTIRKITPAGIVSTLAGKAGESGHADGPAADARFNGSRGITVDKNGTVFVADSDNGAVRKISPSGVVTTVAPVAKP